MQNQTSVALLASCQALATTGNALLITIAALIGYELAPNPTWATFPLAIFHVATMSSTLPAAFLMKQWGRRWGFITGLGIASAGAMLGLGAILTQHFGLFCVATTCLGSFNAFVGHYRFAAAELTDDVFRSRAISSVIAGGIVAALLGPQLATWTRGLFPTALFAGCFVTMLGLYIGSMLLLALIELPHSQAVIHQTSGRPLRILVMQPTFLVAVLGSMVGYGVMVLVMTATPLAMVANQLPFEQAAFVIQWHVLGMFGPSLITGSLITRLGVLTVILVGGILNVLSLGINLMGQTLPHFWVALLLLGVGWNFMFVGSTTLLTETYHPQEKSKAQAIHDFLMFGCVAASALFSGGLLNQVGWAGVNGSGIPMVVLSMIAVAGLSTYRARTLRPST